MTLTSGQVNVLQLISHQAHVVGGRRGKRQEAGEAYPFNPSVWKKGKCTHRHTEVELRHVDNHGTSGKKEPWMKMLRRMGPESTVMRW